MRQLCALCALPRLHAYTHLPVCPNYARLEPDDLRVRGCEDALNDLLQTSRKRRGSQAEKSHETEYIEPMKDPETSHEDDQR